MKYVSNLYKQAMKERRDFYAEADITFANGEKKALGKRDFMTTGNSVVISSGSQSFPIGILASRIVNLSLINDDERWSSYDFYGGKVSLKTKYDLPDNTVESIDMGVFTIVTPETYGETVEITAMDESYKTDIPYSTTLVYPVTVAQGLRDCCQTCGILLYSSNFPNSDYEIPKIPENITHRQFIGMCAMIAGGNAVFDEKGRLKILSYDFTFFDKNSADGGIFDRDNPYSTGDDLDGGSFVPWNLGDVMDGGEFRDRDNIHVLYEFSVGTRFEVDDVVITGVHIEDEDKNIHLYGKSGYILSLSNQFALGKEDDFVQRIGKRIVGLRFRPFTGDHIAYPLADFMDNAYVIDRKGNTYQTVLTDIDFNYYGYTTLKCSAESPIRNSSTYYGNEAKAIIEARKMVEEEKTEREKQLEILANTLANSSGLYITVEKQSDGSSIYYMHNKSTLAESNIVWKLTAEAFGISIDGGKTYPYGFTVDGALITRLLSTEGFLFDWARGGTLRLGGYNNGDGVLSIYNQSNGLIGNINKDGIKIGDKFTVGTDGQATLEGAFTAYSSSNNSKSVNRAGNLYYYKNDTLAGRLTLMESSNGYGLYEEGTNFVKIVGGGLNNYLEIGNALSNETSGCKNNMRGSFCVVGDVKFTSNFTVSGTKSRLCNTKSYDSRLQYCYEMASPYFGDIGNGATDENGICVIALDDIFCETVNPEIEYQVFLQKEGRGDLWVSEKQPYFFVVNGTENLKFSWEVKIKQKNYEYERLEYSESGAEEFEISYETDYEMEIENLLKDQEELLYEEIKQLYDNEH